MYDSLLTSAAPAGRTAANAMMPSRIVRLTHEVTGISLLPDLLPGVVSQVAGIPDLGSRRVPGLLLARSALALTRIGARSSADRMVVYAPGELVARRAGALPDIGGEGDLLAGEHGILELRGMASDDKLAGEFLEVLFERELVVFRPAVALELPAPLAGGDARNHPVKYLASLPDADLLAGRGHFQLEIGRPVAEVVVVRHDPRAGLQGGEQPGAYREVHIGEQVQCKHRRRTDVRLKQVALIERHALRDAGPSGVTVAQLDQPAVEVHAESARPVSAGGRDHHASVTRAQIDDVIIRSDPGYLQHPVDDVLRRLDVGRV